MPITHPETFVGRPGSVHTRSSRSVVGIAIFLLCAAGLIDPAAASSAKGAHTSAHKPAAKSARAPAKKKTRYSSTRARSRRASRLARARAARARAAWLEAQKPRFKTDETGSLVPDVRAAAAIIYNPDNGQVLYEENAQNKRSIASITKVMTAAVVLEGTPDLTRRVTILREDVRGANHTYLHTNDEVSVDDLLHLTLIASDNAAARVLARTSQLGADGFIQRMNEKALELGLDNTTYADPSGLDASNMSSAYDMARLIAFAGSDERISSIMRTPYFTFRGRRGPITVHSTNRLLMKGDVDVRGGKTGFIAKAGYCLATLLRLPQTGQQVAVVVLGARSNAGRFMETRHLFNWLASKAPDFFGTGEPAVTPALATQPQ
jgi:D-alanyl-D-alanine endopeptidase (penicillin-binding protein 7)